MKPQEYDVSRAGWVNPFVVIAGFISKTVVIIELEIRKLHHDPTELIMRAVQPALWLLVFGQVMSNRFRISGNVNYKDFIAPGILAQSVLFIAIFYGISIIWERDLGIVHKFLVTPTPRAALVLGKALSAGVRGLSQVLIIYCLSLIVGVKINWHPLALIGVITIVILGASFFSTLSLVIACLVKTRERFMGIGQVITMPLFFASNAIYPIDIMPTWLKVIARGNPLTYEVDALRSMMLVGVPTVYGFALDFGVLLLATVILVALGSKLYPNVVT